MSYDKKNFELDILAAIKKLDEQKLLNEIESLRFVLQLLKDGMCDKCREKYYPNETKLNQ